MAAVARTDWKRYPAKRDNVLFILRAVQNNNSKNYITDNDLIDVAQYLDMSLAELEGVVSFYSFFSRKPRAKYIIRICDSCSCRIKGSLELYHYLNYKLNIKVGQTTSDELFTIELVNCLGACAKAPNLMINDRLFHRLDNDKISEIIDDIRKKESNG